ncbi:hypothetical protein RhiLY_04090 [Ceratobasidium sp. AG-Ba]|nr:hypothetical protein RhiLY_04090 [Ceratobasidium sp. AG-Ba]
MAQPLAPHTLSLALQYLLPPSEFPEHLLARSLLQRHHFLSISPSDAAAYLCWPHTGQDPKQAIDVLERLATQDHEHLVQTADIRYELPSSSDEPARARVWLGSSVQLVFVWEEDQDGAGWRYFDTGKLPRRHSSCPHFAYPDPRADHRTIPAGCTPTLAPALHITPAPEQEHEPSPGASYSTSSALTSAYSSVSTPASDDYWAGYNSGSAPPSPRMPTRSLGPSAAEEEDAYWASYGAVHGSADSTIPSPAPPQHKKLDAWGREALPWDDQPQEWEPEGDSTARHGLGVTILSDSHPPTPPSLPTQPLTLNTQTQAPVPLPGLDHRNWNSPPSSLSAPFSAMSEPDDAPLDEPDAPAANEPEAPAVSSPTSNVLSPVDAGLSSAIKGMYALWKASQPANTNADESRQAFLAVVGSALADA